MNREEVKQILQVLQAFTEGKTVQFKTYCGDWKDVDDLPFDASLNVN